MARVSSYRQAVIVLAGIAALSAGTAGAQTQPFVFTVTTLPGASSTQKWGAHYEAGYAERTSDPFGYDGVEQRFVVQGALSNGFSVLGQLGVGLNGSADSTTRTSQQIEILKDVRNAREGLGLTFGLGLRREWGGEKVMLGRVALGRSFDRSSLFMNVRFEKPFETDNGQERDGVDLISTWGWMHRVAPSLHLGVEAVGEDLEGLWDSTEAEGGAKIFVGPSLRLAPSQASWSAALSGGPIFYATRNERRSSAQRPLNATDNGFTVRLSLGYSF
jgi:hypothetical protein